MYMLLALHFSSVWAICSEQGGGRTGGFQPQDRWGVRGSSVLFWLALQLGQGMGQEIQRDVLL